MSEVCALSEDTLALPRWLKSDKESTGALILCASCPRFLLTISRSHRSAAEIAGGLNSVAAPSLSSLHA
jgi:hypothetical protein